MLATTPAQRSGVTFGQSGAPHATDDIRAWLLRATASRQQPVIPEGETQSARAAAHTSPRVAPVNLGSAHTSTGSSRTSNRSDATHVSPGPAAAHDASLQRESASPRVAELAAGSNTDAIELWWRPFEEREAREQSRRRSKPAAATAATTKPTSPLAAASPFLEQSPRIVVAPILDVQREGSTPSTGYPKDSKTLSNLRPPPTLALTKSIVGLPFHVKVHSLMPREQL